MLRIEYQGPADVAKLDWGIPSARNDFTRKSKHEIVSWQRSMR